MERRAAALLALVATTGIVAPAIVSIDAACAQDVPDATVSATTTPVTPAEPPAVTPAAAAPSPPLAPTGARRGVDGGFRLEPAPAFDDVFGDAARYRATLDRALALADIMQRTRDGYTRAAQQVIALLGERTSKPSQTALCAQPTLAAAYAHASHLGQRYLDAGRELARHHDQVRNLDRLGESAGLTPDYRAKLRRVVAAYDGLLADYRAMKAVFHGQLDGELRYAGCDPARLLALAPPASGDGVPPAATSSTANSPTAAPPPSPPASAPGDRSGILFYVDNTRCAIGTHAALDGHPLGFVPAATRAAFQTSPGPHDLCLLPVEKDAPVRRCGDPGTLRTAYFHEGWTISLRCE